MTPVGVDPRISEAIRRQAAGLPWRTRSFQRRLKRMLDLLASAVLLAMLWPIILLLALLVRLSSKGPVLFVASRIGLDGRPFRMVKFRTMLATRPDGSAGVDGEVTGADDRLTPVGAWLRAWRLDELPQLVHVLSGKMSLVGPRPDIFENLPRYSERQLLRFAMPPGCTAWTFTRGAFANDWETRQDINVEYVVGWSLWLDLKILAGTLFTLLTQRNTTPAAETGSDRRG